MASIVSSRNDLRGLRHPLLPIRRRKRSVWQVEGGAAQLLEGEIQEVSVPFPSRRCMGDVVLSPPNVPRGGGQEDCGEDGGDRSEEDNGEQ